MYVLCSTLLDTKTNWKMTRVLETSSLTSFVACMVSGTYICLHYSVLPHCNISTDLTGMNLAMAFLKRTCLPCQHYLQTTSQKTKWTLMLSLCYTRKSKTDIWDRVFWYTRELIFFYYPVTFSYLECSLLGEKINK